MSRQASGIGILTQNSRAMTGVLEREGFGQGWEEMVVERPTAMERDGREVARCPTAESCNGFGLSVRGSNRVLADKFFSATISRADRYCRAAAYFSSSVFAVAPDAVESFFAGGGRIELVCSPEFRKDDYHALLSGLYNAAAWQSVSLLDVLGRSYPRWCRDLLSWAVATGRIEIQVALVEGSPSPGIYHEKFGIAWTKNDQVVAFHGSANETGPAYSQNYERILVYTDQNKYSGRGPIASLVRQFELLWKNRTPGLRVLPLHAAFTESVVRIAPEQDSQRGTEVEEVTGLSVQPEIIRWPLRLVLRKHQQEAVDSWFRAGGRGIFSMATGSGKTIAALATVHALHARFGNSLAVVIVAPYLHLVDQWIKEARRFGLEPLRCADSRTKWETNLDAAVFLLNAGKRKVLSVVTTNTTFATKPFQRLLDGLKVRTLLVADEVHNLGAVRLRGALPERINLRLGLSATPERWMDEDGTAAVLRYFGKPVEPKFELADALAASPPVLSPYAYHPIVVELDPDEAEEYILISRALARFLSEDSRTEDLSQQALALLLKRARLVASARRKLPALANVMRPHVHTSHNLVYCGDGRTELEPFESQSFSDIDESPLIRQIEAVVKLVGRDLGMTTASYVAETSAQERVALAERFQAGRLQVLAAIRCLDEGVDFPAVRRAFILASSTNPRQFIQRRGRVLRRAEGKDRADIYDFLVSPPLDMMDSSTAEFRIMRNLVARELSRVTEFAGLALNGPQAIELLVPLKKKLHLLHL